MENEDFLVMQQRLRQRATLNEIDRLKRIIKRQRFLVGGIAGLAAILTCYVCWSAISKRNIRKNLLAQNTKLEQQISALKATKKKTVSKPIKKEKVQKKEVVKPKKKIVSQIEKTPNDSSFYTVQIGYYKNLNNIIPISAQAELQIHQDEDGKSVFLTRHKTVSEAKETLQFVKKLGLKQSFIVAYKNGEYDKNCKL